MQVCAADFCGATELPHFAGKSGNADKSGTSQTVREKAKSGGIYLVGKKFVFYVFPAVINAIFSAHFSFYSKGLDVPS